LTARRWVVVGVAAVIAGATPLAASTLGSAQTLPTLTVDKVVTGAVPPGTTFTVTVVCTITATAGSSGSAATTRSSVTPQTAPPSTTTTITFNAQGDPTSSNMVSPNNVPASCTVTETATGGAQSTSYTCALGSTSLDTTCSTNEQTVTFGADSSGATTVTVTNTFPLPPPPPAVVAAFTG
jgi:hypothetical protein